MKSFLLQPAVCKVMFHGSVGILRVACHAGHLRDTFCNFIGGVCWRWDWATVKIMKLVWYWAVDRTGKLDFYHEVMFENQLLRGFIIFSFPTKNIHVLTSDNEIILDHLEKRWRCLKCSLEPCWNPAQTGSIDLRFQCDAVTLTRQTEWISLWLRTEVRARS